MRRKSIVIIALTFPGSLMIAQPQASPLPPRSGVTKKDADGAEPIRKAKAAYPALARSAKIQGTVTFNASIDEEGKVKSVQLVKGHPLLVQAAKDAALQWVYAPKIVNGKPVSWTTVINLEVSP